LERVRKDFEPRCEFYFEKLNQYFLTDNYPEDKPLLKALVFDLDGTLSPNLTYKWIEGLFYTNPEFSNYKNKLLESFKLLISNNVDRGLKIIKEVFKKCGFNEKHYEESSYYALENSEWYKGVKKAINQASKYGYLIFVDTATPNLIAKLVAELYLEIPPEFATGSEIVFDKRGKFSDIILNVDVEKFKRKEELLRRNSMVNTFNIILEDDPVQNFTYLINTGFNPILILDKEKFSRISENKLSSYSLVYPELREDYSKLWPLVLKLERWYLFSSMKSEKEVRKILFLEKQLKAIDKNEFIKNVTEIVYLMSPFFPENTSGIWNLLLEFELTKDKETEKTKRSEILGLIKKYTELL
jgi:phosphoserine phosphatase